MQKFGLQRHCATNSSNSSSYSAVELEIVREQASALGRAGKKLRISLEAYQAQLDGCASCDQLNQLLHAIANNVWELMLQREFVGFIDGNLTWITNNYLIPDDAITLIGPHA